MTLELVEKNALGVPEEERTANTLGYLCSLWLAALAPIPVVLSATNEKFNPARVSAALIALIVIHLVRYPWLAITREMLLYAALTAYMGVSVLWAPEGAHVSNTLIPAANCLLIMVLFGALIAFHDLRAVFKGLLGGFVLSVLGYTYVSHFPFIYPEDFSYNAVAGLYLSALFITVLYSWFMRRMLLPVGVIAVLLALVAATTSIKTNLGIAAGGATASLLYIRRSFGVLKRFLIPLAVVGALLAYAVINNDSLMERLQNGFKRVSVGVNVLQAREDVSTTTSYGERQYWQRRGLAGWLRNPVLGNGVEAFRNDYGITSHSTAVDLLYNSGIIGFGLFYGIFLSLTWRLWQTRAVASGNLHTIIFAGIVCYSSMTLSGTLHYNGFVAIFFAISAALLAEQRRAQLVGSRA